MKLTIKKIAAIAACVLTALAVNAQEQIHSLYFLDNAVMRHTLNPAFEPWENVYVGLPALGFTSINVSNNSLMVSNVLSYQNGKTVTALAPGGDKVGLFDALKSNTLVNGDIRMNVLSFGARGKKYGGYWHFGFSERLDVSANIPSDLLRLPLFGMGRPDGSHHIEDQTLFQLKNLGFDASLYAELLFGYSHTLPKNDKWTLGGALKILIGQDNAMFQANELYIDASRDRWEIVGDAYARMAAPVELTYEYNYPETHSGIKGVDVNATNRYGEYAKPRGFGAAIDFGFTFRPVNFVEISAAILDLGGIYWIKEGTQHTAKFNDYIYQGAEIDINDNNDVDLGKIYGDIWDEIKDRASIVQTNKDYFRMIKAKLNVGAEIYTPNKMIGFGILSSTKLYDTQIYEDLTASVNFRPAQWFNLSANYNFMNLKQHAIGAAMGLRGGPLSLTLAMDYVPFEYAQMDVNGKQQHIIPYRSKGVNLAVGLNLVFGWKRDKDRDGVKDMHDVCPTTPFRQYKKQGIKIMVDENGCPLDEDGDGVPDYLDKCPGTPVQAYGLVDLVGCPLDTDKDGVPDYLDQCPDTPEAARNNVDSVGCPRDTDHDGVPDYLDECPDTPAAARGYVDAKGCPKDSDFDGVPDYLDQCPDTPEAARATVDERGCPRDTDGDDVPDYLDQCPGTPAAARGFVDERGCPKDTDGDGVPDYLDKCPAIFGVISNNGCPENKEIRALFKKAMQGIQFDVNKATIKKKSYPILNKIVKVFVDNPTWKAEVQGHTDSTGRYDYNIKLSDDRANSVRNYLVEHGVEPERLTAKGYGPDKPIASNKTASGRQLNRRTEFDITYEDVVTEENKSEAIDPHEVILPSEDAAPTQGVEPKAPEQEPAPAPAQEPVSTTDGK